MAIPRSPTPAHSIVPASLSSYPADGEIQESPLQLVQVDGGAQSARLLPSRPSSDSATYDLRRMRAEGKLPNAFPSSWIRGVDAAPAVTLGRLQKGMAIEIAMDNRRFPACVVQVNHERNEEDGNYKNFTVTLECISQGGPSPLRFEHDLLERSLQLEIPGAGLHKAVGAHNSKAGSCERSRNKTFEERLRDTLGPRQQAVFDCVKAALSLVMAHIVSQYLAIPCDVKPVHRITGWSRANWNSDSWQAELGELRELSCAPPGQPMLLLRTPKDRAAERLAILRMVMESPTSIRLTVDPLKAVKFGLVDPSQSGGDLHVELLFDLNEIVPFILYE